MKNDLVKTSRSNPIIEAMLGGMAGGVGIALGLWGTRKVLEGHKRGAAKNG